MDGVDNCTELLDFGDDHFAVDFCWIGLAEIV